MSFKPKSLITFGKSKISDLEKIEDVELLRALDIGLKIKTLNLKGDYHGMRLRKKPNR